MLQSVFALSGKNLGKLIILLESDIYKNICIGSLLFILDGKTVYIYDDYPEILFTFGDLGE